MRTTITAIVTLLATPLAFAAPQPSSTHAANATVSPASSNYLASLVMVNNDKNGLYVSKYPINFKSWAQPVLFPPND